MFFIGLTLFVQSTGYPQALVGLSNGQEYRYKTVALKKPAFSSAYLLADDSIKYPLADVKYYEGNSGYFLRSDMGTAANEFMHREQTGNIELYSVMRWTSSYNSTTGESSMSKVKVNYYKKRYGTIKKLTGGNLSMDLMDCPKCLQEVKKGKGLSTVGAIGVVVGLGIFVGTAATTLSKPPTPGETKPMPAGVIIGPIFCLTPWLVKGAKRKHYQAAIDLYNGGY